MGRGHSKIEVGGTGGSQYELRVTQTLNGDIDSIRGRLASALQRLGYDVLSEEPALEARRGARGWAKWGGSSGVLESSVALTIWLKADSPYVTHAIFDYKSWADASYKKGDMEVLASESRAIAALAAAQSTATVCSACGTEERDESRFCRHCGAPKSAAPEPAELEVLRLMAETRAGQIPFTFSAAALMVSCLLTVVAAIVGIVIGTPGATGALLALMFIGGGLGCLSLIWTILGMRRLRRALTHDDASQRAMIPGSPKALGTRVSAQPAVPLTSSAVMPSVTEGTTEILQAESEEPVTAPRRMEGGESH
jgi:hypothetical protein